MPRVTLPVPEDQYRTLSELWAASKEMLSPDALHQLGWDDIGAFYLDLITWGLESAQKNPFEFITQMRERKNPVFRDIDTIKRIINHRSDDESMRAYA